LDDFFLISSQGQKVKLKENKTQNSCILAMVSVRLTVIFTNEGIWGFFQVKPLCVE